MRTAVEKALEELVDVVPAGADGFYYQGQELKDKKCKEVMSERMGFRGPFLWSVCNYCNIGI